MAAEALIDESVRDPGRFFRVNVTGSLNLLDAMVAAGVSADHLLVDGSRLRRTLRDSDPRGRACCGR